MPIRRMAQEGASKTLGSPQEYKPPIHIQVNRAHYQTCDEKYVMRKHERYGLRILKPLNKWIDEGCRHDNGNQNRDCSLDSLPFWSPYAKKLQLPRLPIPIQSRRVSVTCN